MYAWILDESPGTYRWGEIDPTPSPARTRCVVSVVASALNHMDLWVTRGMPKPPLPHVPGCDVAGIVDAVGDAVTSVAVGDEVVVNPAVSPVDDIIALGNDSPMGSGFGIYGEHDRGRPRQLRDRPGAQRREAPVEPNLGGVRGVPAVLPDGLPDAASGPARRGRHAARRRHRRRRRHRGARARARRWAPTCR